MNENPALNDNQPINLPVPAPAAEPLPIPEGELHIRLREDCLYFLALAAALGIVYAVCFVETYGWGLNFVIYAAAWVVCAHLALRRLGVADLRRDGFWYGGILLLALTIFWTANPFIQFVSFVGGILCQCFWALNVFADISQWRFGKASAAVIRLVFRAIGRYKEPFRHLSAVRKAHANAQKRANTVYILIGLAAALPMAVVAVLLLSSADAAFRHLFARLFDIKVDLHSMSLSFKSLCAFLLGTVAFYGLLCAQTDRPEPQEQAQVERFNTLVAITFTAVLAAIYIVFCLVQASVLFTGGETLLPEGYTYAQYAREGFFQLLAVSAMNVLLVIVSQQRFHSSRTLSVLLCVVSGCTYLMELSSAWRMILYVRVYGFTFLRLLVLWFLLVLAVVLGGAVVTVFRPDFRLFRFTLTVCLVCWLVFAFARPDNLAAKYNLRRFGPTEKNLSHIYWDLYADSIEELAPYLSMEDTEIPDYMDRNLRQYIPASYKNAGVRGFNYSMWRAYLVAEEYSHGE